MTFENPKNEAESDAQERDLLVQEAARLSAAGDVRGAENLRGLADVWTSTPPKKQR
jgi:hypothetical protein